MVTDYILIPENADSIKALSLSQDRIFFAISYVCHNDPCPMISIFHIKNAFHNGEKFRNFRYTENKVESID